jgi:hypothetical protein
MRRSLALVCLVTLGACGPTKTASDAGTDAGTDAGASAACTTCVMHGQWALANLSPCIVASPSPDGGPDLVSAVVSTTFAGGAVQCPSDLSVAPSTPWSSDTVKVDCPGHYRFCFTFKAGSAATPSAADCTIVTACAEDDAPQGGVVQTWAPVESWRAASAPALECARRFQDTGGYGEMSVSGQATGCGSVDRVVNRVSYCPQRCNFNPSASGCETCGAGGNGVF